MYTPASRRARPLGRTNRGKDKKGLFQQILARVLLLHGSFFKGRGEGGGYCVTLVFRTYVHTCIHRQWTNCGTDVCIKMGASDHPEYALWPVVRYELKQFDPRRRSTVCNQAITVQIVCTFSNTSLKEGERGSKRRLPTDSKNMLSSASGAGE